MLFQAMMKFLSRLVEFKILVNWGMVHSLTYIYQALGYLCSELYPSLYWNMHSGTMCVKVIELYFRYING